VSFAIAITGRRCGEKTAALRPDVRAVAVVQQRHNSNATLRGWCLTPAIESASRRRGRIVVQRTQSRCKEISQRKSVRSDSKAVSSIKQQNQNKSPKGDAPMARLDSGYLPRENPCAQCGKLIPRPDWVESSPGRTSFLWFCRACDYRFEAIAIYEEAHPDSLAA
jgi:hypothetical protein